jgi:lipid-binding SYLF domain-containing protein
MHMTLGFAKTLGAFVAAASMAVSLPALAGKDENKAEAAKIVNGATKTLKNFSADPSMTWFRDNIPNAKAVLIVPKLVKAGFVFGGSGGHGVVLSRDEKAGVWRGPSFATAAAASVGFQAGVSVAEVVMMAMTEKGKNALLSNKFQVGADVSVAAGPVGAGAQAATTDILQFVRAKGLYGGLNLEGTVIDVRDSLNAAFYGKKVSPVDILVKGEVKNPQADALVQQLTGTAKK